MHTEVEGYFKICSCAACQNGAGINTDGTVSNRKIWDHKFSDRNSKSRTEERMAP